MIVSVLIQIMGDLEKSFFITIGYNFNEGAHWLGLFGNFATDVPTLLTGITS